MARKRAIPKSELQARTILNAYRILAEEGREALTARNVAKATGFSPGTLYNLFGDLPDLVQHMNAMTLADFERYLKDHCDLAATGREALLAMAQAYSAYARANAPRWLLLFEPAADDRPVPHFLQERIHALFMHLETALVPLCRSEAQCRRGARVIWAGIHGITILALGDKLGVIGEGDMDVLQEELVSTYLHGLATQP